VPARHRATERFWKLYGQLQEPDRAAADKAFGFLKVDPNHPSLHFKQVGGLVSVRFGRGVRALAEADQDGYTWVWIGTHAEYDGLLRRN